MNSPVDWDRRGMLSGRSSGNLDLLRSLAVLCVMLDHLVPTMVRHGLPVAAPLVAWTAHLGQAGVLAFFVHTSLVLMFSLDKLAHESRGREGHARLTARFYVRRLMRIYPLAWMAIALVLLCHLPAMTWRETPPVTLSVVIANLLLVQNLVTGQSVLGPLWSLPYEVEMYVVLPALYLLARRPTGPRVLVAMIVLSSAIGLWLASVTGGRLNMVAYLPVFLCGVACHAWRRHGRAVLSARLWPVLIGALILGYAALHLQRDRPDPALGWLFGALLSLAILHSREVPPSRWHVPVAQVVARYSYGLYLLHVPVLHLVFQLWQPASLPLAVLAYFGLTAAASCLAYHLIEAPMVTLGQRLSPLRSPVAGSGAMRSSAQPG